MMHAGKCRIDDFRTLGVILNLSHLMMTVVDDITAQHPASQDSEKGSSYLTLLLLSSSILA